MHISSPVQLIVATALGLSAFANPIAETEPSVPRPLAPAASQLSELPGPGTESRIVYGRILTAEEAAARRAKYNFTAPIGLAIDERDTTEYKQKRPFGGSCRYCEVADYHYLDCECRNNGGTYYWTSLDLGECIEDRDGILRWRY
ncbi:hypothetical protein V8F20_001414 [Naviculisporaceae sp. PSN 640]